MKTFLRLKLHCLLGVKQIQKQLLELIKVMLTLVMVLRSLFMLRTTNTNMLRGLGGFD
uniref:Uncharacterized protein n=1 Tax=Medicago truncatula TaxID=3880 RepID=I3SX44_MEDTR|nr:unknown [Medicago truncatula]